MRKDKTHVIEIYLSEEWSFHEKYNRNKISKDLIHYLIESVSPQDKKEQITIVIYNSLGQQIDLSMLKDGIKEEYEKCLKEHRYNDHIQHLYFVLGILMLLCSYLISFESVFQDILVISGWVLLWNMIEIEMFSDSDNRKKRKILKKLYHAEVIEKKDC